MHPPPPPKVTVEAPCKAASRQTLWGAHADVDLREEMGRTATPRPWPGTETFALLPTQYAAPATCGPTVTDDRAQRCPEGECCSAAGECGMTADHCHPNANSAAFNGYPSGWRCARGARRTRTSSTQSQSDPVFRCPAPYTASPIDDGAVATIDPARCGPLVNQFCPWSHTGADACCVRDVYTKNGTCQPCKDMTATEAHRVWMYDNDSQTWF